MKSIRLDVSSVSPPSFQISFLFSPPPTFLLPLAFHRIPSASCWVTSPWEADTMVDRILSTPSEPCFPRDSPGPVGMKPILFCSSGQLGPAGKEHVGFRAPRRCFLPSLISAQVLLPAEGLSLSLYILFLVCLQHHLRLQLSVSICLLSPSPSVHLKLSVLFLCGAYCLVYNLESRHLC